MGGESEAAWRALLDDLVARGLKTPEFLIVDGAAGLEKALAALWPEVPTQRCTVHKHRNLLAHAPDPLHEEVSADYTDMIYAATPKEVGEAPHSTPAQVAAEVPGGRRQPGGSGRPAVHLHPPAARPVALGAHHQCRRTAARGVQTADQDADRAAITGDRRHAVLGPARLRTDHHAQGQRLADAGHQADRHGH